MMELNWFDPSDPISNLQNLLAVLCRDGGHYCDAHGMKAAIAHGLENFYAGCEAIDIVKQHDLCHNLHGKVDARAFADGCATEAPDEGDNPHAPPVTTTGLADVMKALGVPVCEVEALRVGFYAALRWLNLEVRDHITRGLPRDLQHYDERYLKDVLAIREAMEDWPE